MTGLLPQRGCSFFSLGENTLKTPLQKGEKGVGLLAGPVGFAQEGEAGFDAGVALEALSEIRKRDSVRHRFAAVPLAQAPHAGCQRDSISTTEPALT